MRQVTNRCVQKWVADMSGLTRPDRIVWIDGSEAQLEALRREAVATGELIALNGEKLPGCYLHRSDPNDVARVEARTFICSVEQKDAGPTNNWCAPAEMEAKLRRVLTGAMEGRTMYIVPYSMGVPGSPFAKYGVELTDSIYVVLNMAIMTRVGDEVIDALGDDELHVVRGLHAKATLDPEERYIAHFPAERVIISVNSNYGGNVLQGKKCFALRIASVQGRDEGWLAEHMLILGLQNPAGKIRYIAAAFPSACGKTNLAMLVPPEEYARQGWKVWCVGDDIAWLRPGPDGRLWAVNPENGFFGVAPGTSAHTNPNALAATHRNTIFTNVAQAQADNTVWWEGLTKTPPEGGLIDWRGEPWTPERGTKAAHPNSRFTAPAKNCPCISPEFENPAGVPLSAIVFGGRRSQMTPLVYQSRDWAHGVFIGSIMSSETTAAATGDVGVVRHDPMAMLPFCGYHMCDYWQHWLDVGAGLTDPPQIFTVNWFRTDKAGRFIWPGFGENIRVLDWIVRRCEGKVDARETALGYIPRLEDLDLEELPISRHDLEGILRTNRVMWRHECRDIRRFYARFDGRVPEPLLQMLAQLEKNLEPQHRAPHAPEPAGAPAR